MGFLNTMLGLLNAMPGAIAQGLIWGIMAVGVYITYKILDLADLTVDGSMVTGMAVCAMLMAKAGWNVWPAMLVAFLAGMAAGSLLRSAKVSPLRLTLLYLAIELLLSEIGTALDRLTQESSAALDPTTITPDELLDLFASFFIARTPIQWTVLFLSIFISLLLWVLKAGYSSYCLGVSRGELTPYESLFDGFAFVGKVLALTFLMLLLIGVGLSFFLLPGILFFLMYRFALYNLCTDPSISIWEAMKRSRLQTDGRKMELFLLNLSFLPLILLLLAAEVY